MASFGQLEIQYPDGRVEWAELIGESASVGRAPDNTIVIGDEAISPHHFQLRAVDGADHLINLDARVGTRVSGKLVRDGAPVPLGAWAEIVAGGVRMIFHGEGAQLTVPTVGLSEQTQPTIQAIEVTLERETLEVFPGSNASLEIRPHQPLYHAPNIW